MHECTCSRAEQHQQSLPGPRLQTARPDAGAGRAPALASLEAANIGVTLSRPAPGLRAPLQRSAPSRGALAARHPGKPCILPRVAVSPQQRSAPGAAPRQRAARPVLKSFKEKRSIGMFFAIRQWSAILAQFGGNTWKRAQHAQPGDQARLIPAVLRRWSHKTLTAHARNVQKFAMWHLEAKGAIQHDSFVDPDVAENTLIQYFLDLTDGEPAATTPSSRWSSLGFLSRLAAFTPGLPLEAPAVHNIVLSYRREVPLQPREPTVYTVRQVRQLEKAATALPGALERVALRNELRKIYAALRHDDSVWDTPSKWILNGGEESGFLSGTAYKTKSTEATSVRLRQGMPWVAPLAGVSPKPTAWIRGYFDDLAAVGVPANAEFAVPSSRPGQPVGAAEPDEHISTVRRALRLAGFPPDASRRIGHHSAKRTILTWAGSSGMLTKEDREILGHHRSAGNGTTVRAYNLKELAAPVRKLGAVLQAIAEDRFAPDSPIGLQWDRAADAPAQGAPCSSVAAPAAAGSQLSEATGKAACTECGGELSTIAPHACAWSPQCLAKSATPAPPGDSLRSRSPDTAEGYARQDAPAGNAESSSPSPASPASSRSPSMAYSPRSPGPPPGPPAPPEPTEPSARTPLTPVAAAGTPPMAAHGDARSRSPPQAGRAAPMVEPEAENTAPMHHGDRAPAEVEALIPVATQGTPRNLWWHIPVPLASRPFKAGRLAVETPGGLVTNLCDFNIKKAVLMLPPTGLGYKVCRICNARQMRLAAADRSGV